LSERKPNALASEKSPYLLRHAYNPVHWRPWGNESLKKAKNDGKPILLSIGYMSCHWCTVMERESFEDRETAEIINANFIPIKVDREERPDVDAYFMNAAQAMTGSGGWPLNVFLTPDLEPFYAGTYFPPEPRYGMPSFRQVLEFAAKFWKERRGEAVSTGRQVMASLRADGDLTGGELSRELVDGAYDSLVSSFDLNHGGFGLAPKFPLPMTVSFMLRYHYRTGKELAMKSATKTLDAIAAGGIRDHVGGGFHRYATDRAWLVPHFEKMLYDNALLAKVFTEAHQATKNESYARAARGTLGWMKREMEARGGGFYSAQDADTAEGEGVFYTWTPDEVESVLGEGDAGTFCRAFGVTRAGNFEGGRSILHLAESTAPPAKAAEWMNKLYDARGARPRPQTDTKIVTSWNGLAISAFAYAGAAFDYRAYTDSAERAADFILAECHRDGRLLRRHAGGEAGIEGTLEDYAFFSQGLLDLFESTGDPRRLQEATELTEEMVQGFQDAAAGGFFSSRETWLARTKESYDGPTPSGNSVAAMSLLRLSELTGEENYRGLADRTLRHFRSRLEEQPSGHAFMMAAADCLLRGMKEIVITAPRREDAAPMLEALAKDYHPAAVLMVADNDSYGPLSKVSTLLEGRGPEAKPRAYVCENFACKLPAGTPRELMAQLTSRN
jgi:uncharacterized protein YyaL (SSP411 family)